MHHKASTIEAGKIKFIKRAMYLIDDDITFDSAGLETLKQKSEEMINTMMLAMQALEQKELDSDENKSLIWPETGEYSRGTYACVKAVLALQKAGLLEKDNLQKLRSNPNVHASKLAVAVVALAEAEILTAPNLSSICSYPKREVTEQDKKYYGFNIRGRIRKKAESLVDLCELLQRFNLLRDNLEACLNEDIDVEYCFKSANELARKNLLTQKSLELLLAYLRKIPVRDAAPLVNLVQAMLCVPAQAALNEEILSFVLTGDSNGVYQRAQVCYVLQRCNELTKTVLNEMAEDHTQSDFYQAARFLSLWHNDSLYIKANMRMIIKYIQQLSILQDYELNSIINFKQRNNQEALNTIYGLCAGLMGARSYVRMLNTATNEAWSKTTQECERYRKRGADELASILLTEGPSITSVSVFPPAAIAVENLSSAGSDPNSPQDYSLRTVK